MHQVANDIGRNSGYPFVGQHGFSRLDVFVELLSVFATEGRFAGQEFLDEGA